MCNTPDAPAKKPDDRMNQGGNYWTLFTPGIWKVLHAVFHFGPFFRAKVLIGETFPRTARLIFYYICDPCLPSESTAKEQ
jgi:hypothetical protein